MMTLLSIVATFECEGCGEKFNVDIPFVDQHRPGECAMDLAKQRLITIEDDAPHSYIAETVLCGTCTRKIKLKRLTAGPYSKLAIRGPTRSWVLEQLDAIGHTDV